MADELDTLDAEADRILSLSSEELNAEIRADGGDPEEMAAEVKAGVDFVLSELKPYNVYRDKIGADITPFSAWVARARSTQAEIADLRTQLAASQSAVIEARRAAIEECLRVVQSTSSGPFSQNFILKELSALLPKDGGGS